MCIYISVFLFHIICTRNAFFFLFSYCTDILQFDLTIFFVLLSFSNNIKTSILVLLFGNCYLIVLGKFLAIEFFFIFLHYHTDVMNVAKRKKQRAISVFFSINVHQTVDYYNLIFIYMNILQGEE